MSGARAALNAAIKTRPFPGAARIRRVAPNPAGALAALFVIDGDFIPDACAGLVAAGPEDVPPVEPLEDRALKLFHVNDMHNHLFDHDAHGRIVHRLAWMEAQVAVARHGAAARNGDPVLFLSAGDDHTGTILDELVGWNSADFIADPSYRALSAAGLDAAALGNHEFDRGTEQLALGLTEAAFPVLSANVHGSRHLMAGRHYHAAALGVTAGGARVGFVGLTTRVETRTGRPEDPGLAVAPPPQVLAHVLPLLSSLSDAVVILSHCGFGDGSHASGKAPVARDIGEADFALADTTAVLCQKPVVIVGGHTHTLLNRGGTDPGARRRGVLITQAGANGKYLGRISLPLETGPGSRPQADVLEVPDHATDHESRSFADLHIAPLAARVDALRTQVIGTATGGELSWPRTRARRYMGETALANFMNDTLVEALSDLPAGAPDLALLNGASILAGLDPGPVTFGQWFDVMPYADEIHILTATGADLAAILQSNAARLLRREERGPDDLVDGFVARGFVHASRAVRYAIDPGKDAASARATGITLDGQPLEAQHGRVLRIAMTTYLALGSFGERWNGKPLSGGIPGQVPGYDLRRHKRTNTGLIYRDVLTRRIRKSGRICAAPDGRLRIV